MSGMARWVTLTAALCLLALPAAALPIDPYGAQAQAEARASAGQPVPGHGPCVGGAFCDVNQDTGALFTSANDPQVPGDTLFFGILVDSTRSRGGAAGGAAAGIQVCFNLAACSAPEPAALALLAGGCAVLALSARRRSLLA